MGERFGMSVLHGYNEGLFLWPVSRQIRQTFLFLGKVFRFRWSELLIYNERTFFPAKTPRQGTLHDGFLVRANSAVRRRKEPYIRNPGIPSPSKQGTLHKEPLPAVKRSHRKEG